MNASNLLPQSTDEFRSVAYWDDFFAQGKAADFEWYTDAKTLMPIIEEHTHAFSTDKSGVRIVIPGCGTSDLAFQLHEHGYNNLYPCDYSNIALANVRAKAHQVESCLKFYNRDACKLSTYTDAEALEWFKPNSIDLVLDKGLLDSISSDFSDPAVRQCTTYLHEIKRLVKPGNDNVGTILIVTMAQPRVLDILHSEFPLENWVFEVKFIPSLADDVNRYQPVVIALTRKTLPKDKTSLSYVIDSSLVHFQHLPHAETKRVETSFGNIKLAIAEEQNRRYHSTTSAQVKNVANSLVARRNYRVEVKPADIDTNLEELRSQVEKFVRSNSGLNCDSIHTQPIAYGLQKLVVNITALSDGKSSDTLDIDSVVEAMQDELGEDLVQSIDLVY